MQKMHRVCRFNCIFLQFGLSELEGIMRFHWTNCEMLWFVVNLDKKIQLKWNWWYWRQIDNMRNWVRQLTVQTVFNCIALICQAYLLLFIYHAIQQWIPEMDEVHELSSTQDSFQPRSLGELDWSQHERWICCCWRKGGIYMLSEAAEDGFVRMRLMGFCSVWLELSLTPGLSQSAAN